MRHQAYAAPEEGGHLRREHTLLVVEILAEEAVVIIVLQRGAVRRARDDLPCFSRPSGRCAEKITGHHAWRCSKRVRIMRRTCQTRRAHRRFQPRGLPRGIGD